MRDAAAAMPAAGGVLASAVFAEAAPGDAGAPRGRFPAGGAGPSSPESERLRPPCEHEKQCGGGGKDDAALRQTPRQWQQQQQQPQLAAEAAAAAAAAADNAPLQQQNS